MKRPLIVLVVVTLLGIISPSPPVIAQTPQTPHEDPDAAIVALDTMTLLLSYTRVISLATNRSYREANKILEEINATDIPEDMRYVIDHYYSLCQQLFTTMENLDSHLDEAAELLSRNRPDEAKQEITGAEVEISKADSLLEEIKIATCILCNETGISAGWASGAVKSAGKHLEESLERLEQLLNEHHQHLYELNDNYLEEQKLVTTQLSLKITPVSVFVGDNITVSGRLTGGGAPLAGRVIHLKDKEFTTFDDGSYAAIITVPFEYKDNFTLSATYYPEGNDAVEYLAAESPPQSIGTKFHRTALELSVDKDIHPGLPFNISGRVSSTGADCVRTVTVYLDHLLQVEKRATAEFHLQVIPPEPTPNGEHVLTVTVKPQGRYSGFSETRIIDISRLPVYLDVQTPMIAFLLKQFRINGRVYNDTGPVADATVNIDYKDSSNAVKTSSEGDFTLYFAGPPDLSLIEKQDIHINVLPEQTWLEPYTSSRTILTINPITTGFILMVLISLVVLAGRKRTIGVNAETERVCVESNSPPVTGMSPKPRPVLSGIEGRILNAYHRGLDTVEKVTGVDMSPHITLREFLKMTSLLAPSALNRFAELTDIAEITLYSNTNPHENTATRAEELAASINRESCHETS